MTRRCQAAGEHHQTCRRQSDIFLVSEPQMTALALSGASHTCREVAAGELFCCSAAHQHSQLTPDLVVKHEGPVLRLGRGVGEPQGTPTAGYDAQLLHLQHMQRLSKEEVKLVFGIPQECSSLMSWLGEKGATLARKGATWEGATQARVEGGLPWLSRGTTPAARGGGGVYWLEFEGVRSGIELQGIPRKTTGYDHMGPM